MPSSAEQAARRNQHPGVVEGSMAGGGNGVLCSIPAGILWTVGGVTP